MYGLIILAPDNERQLGTVWRNSCFLKINTDFGFLSPSHKILIRAIESLQFVSPDPTICQHPGSVFVHICSWRLRWTHLDKGLFSSLPVPVSSRDVLLCISISAFQDNESTAWNNDRIFQSSSSFIILAHTLQCDMTGYKWVLNALWLDLQSQVEWKGWQYS